MSKARQLADLGNVYDDGALSNRNLIINGAMQVAQRGTSFSGVTSSQYGVDRFLETGSIGTRTVSQETDAPSGFSSSLKTAITTAESPPASGDFLLIEHRMEGQNLQMLKKGTADALPVTVSFWVKSNVTGTYILELDDNDNSRNINASYTINSSGTWEYKTITLASDTTGAFDNDANFSARLIWWLDAGSDFRGGTLATSWASTVNANRAVGNVSFGSTIGNYWQITGVQLEVGDTATPFEHRSYGDELARCQRYYYDTELSMVIYATANGFYGVPVTHPVEMRASPAGNISGGNLQAGANASVTYRNPTSFRFTLQPSADGGVYYDNAIITMDAEL